MLGGNRTDISQFSGVQLITKYWSEFKERITDVSYIFVGDVHGDLHQFLALVVMSGLIKLTGKVVELEGIPLPECVVNSSVNVNVIYLGDLVDEWIFGRTILKMIYDLLKKKRVRLTHGNLECLYIGKFPSFQKKSFDFYSDIPALWTTLKSELCCKLEVSEQLYEYTKPYFEIPSKIFSERLGFACIAVSVNEKPFIVSHCTWTKRALKNLFNYGNKEDGSSKTN